jgi:hypothetical protein
MSVATLSDTLPGLPIGQPKTRWFKAPDAEDDPANPGDFDNWPKAARRLWKILLRQARKLGTKVVLLPVWKLAEMCGRGQRWVWKAFRQLLTLGVIRRFWCDGRKEVENRKGHHGEVGRATEIVIDLAGPEPKAKPKTKAKGQPAAKPATGTGELDKIKAAIAQAEAEKAADPAAARPQGATPNPTPTPTETDRHGWLKRLVASIAAGPPHAEDPDPDRTEARRREVLDGLAATQQAREAEMARREREKTAGPEVPAPGSGS